MRSSMVRCSHIDIDLDYVERKIEATHCSTTTIDTTKQKDQFRRKDYGSLEICGGKRPFITERIWVKVKKGH